MASPHDHPVVSRRRGDSLGGGGDRVAEPAQAVDRLAALVQQAVVHHQVERARRVQRQDDRHSDLVGQGLHGPGAAAEEVGEPIEGMMLDPRDHGAGVDGLEDPILGPRAEAHDPAEEEVPGGLETRFGEGDGQDLYEGIERWDDRPHGGRILVAWGVSKTRFQPQVYRSSPTVSLPRNLRKFRKMSRIESLSRSSKCLSHHPKSSL